MATEVSFVSIVGSRLALSRPRLRRLTALSRRPARTWEPRWSRRSGLGVRPCLVVADDGVEGGKQFAHDSDDGEAGGFACVAQASVEAAQRRVVPDGDQACHEKRGAHFDASPLDASLAAIGSAVAVHRRAAGGGGDLVATVGGEW